jgi:hypothetical protein
MSVEIFVAEPHGRDALLFGLTTPMTRVPDPFLKTPSPARRAEGSIPRPGASTRPTVSAISCSNWTSASIRLACGNRSWRSRAKASGCLKSLVPTLWGWSRRPRSFLAGRRRQVGRRSHATSIPASNLAAPNLPFNGTGRQPNCLQPLRRAGNLQFGTSVAASDCPSLRRCEAPSPDQALPCMQANNAGRSRASLSISAGACVLCEK